MSIFTYKLHYFNEKISKFNKWILIFYIMITFENIVRADYTCKNNNALQNTQCFNNLIILNNKAYRSGHFVTTKEGELIIEYSEDSIPGQGRLFYRLTKEGRGYYDDDNPIREFTVTNSFSTKNEKNEDITCSGRYEARNILINIDGDTTGKEYLFSTSTWYSFTELHDLDSGNFYSWFTSTFFNIADNKYIFSYQFEILKIPNQSIYFLVYNQYGGGGGMNNGNAYSESYVIKKFKISGFIETNPYNEVGIVTNTDNENSRVISAFIMDNRSLLVLFYLKTGANLYFKTYDYSLSSTQETSIASISDYQEGIGYYFKALYLGDDYAAVVYFPNGDVYRFRFGLYKYDTSFSEAINQEIGYRAITNSVSNNDFYKVKSNRLIYASSSDKLYIFLIDLYNSYQTVIVNVYDIAKDGYSLDKELTAYFFNGYIFFTSTVNNNNVFSILMIFGYANGKDSYIEISPYLSDSNNTDTTLSIFDYFLNKIVINNNIFEYEKVSQVKLVTIPPELKLYINDVKLEDGAIITENPKILQNQDLMKTYKNYSIYYQLYVKEPNYTHYIGSSHLTKCLTKDTAECDVNSIKEEYENRDKPALEGKSIKMEFKLCHEYCETCQILGISIHNQYCVTCLPQYRYDY